MVSIKKIKSITDKKDVFGLKGPFNIDHTWPLSKGGSDIPENKTKLSIQANEAKGSKTRGVINGVRFSVVKVKTKQIEGVQHSFGVLYVMNKKGEWEVVKYG